MKKILFWSVVTLLAAVSCNKEMETPAVTGGDAMTFVAAVDGAETKTILDGVKNYWNGTEHIGVLDGTIYKFFTAADQAMTETAVFTEDDSETKFEGDDYVAIYPANNANWTGDIADPVKGLWLNPDQQPVADTYGPNAHVAVAYTNAESNQLMFKNASALIKFTVGNENASNPCFYGNKGEIISGNFDVLYNDGDPVVTRVVTDPAPEGYYYQTYAKLKGGVNVGDTYYIAVLPATFEQGFTFELEVEGLKYTKKTDKAVTLVRNQILDLGTITFEPVEVDNKTIYFKPSEAWKADGAWFSTWCWYEGHEGRWYDMSDPDGDGIYEVEVPETITNIIFVRMNAGTTAHWDNMLGQTDDLTVDNECYVHDTAAWMTLEDAKQLDTVPYTWYLIGGFNGWAQKDPAYAMTFDGEYYFYDNFTLETAAEMKFMDGSNWRSGVFAGANAAIVLDSGGNMSVPAGIYDVYLAEDGNTAYIMKDGKTPDQAGDPEVDYIDGSTLAVGLSGVMNGWGDPSGNYLASFDSKTITDASKYAGNYVYVLSGVELSGDFKVRVNGGWYGTGNTVIEGLSYTGDDNISPSESGTFNIHISFDWDGLTQSNVKAVFSR